MLASNLARVSFDRATENMGVSQEDVYNVAIPVSGSGVYFTYSYNIQRNVVEPDNDSDSSESSSDASFSDEEISTSSNNLPPQPHATEHKFHNSTEYHSTPRNTTAECIITEITDKTEETCAAHENLEVHRLCVRSKYGRTIIGLPDQLVEASTTNSAQKESDDKLKKKKKKWKKVGAEEMGFRLSLFPRVPVNNDKEIEDEKELDISAVLEMEEEEMMGKVPQQAQQLIEVEGQGIIQYNKVLRRDSDRRVQKAHRQVKSKNLTSLLNNKGRKTLYIHFRLYKRFGFLQCDILARAHPNLPSAPKRPGVCLDVARSACKAQQKANTASNRHATPPQNLAHALDTLNAASDLPTDVISFLISLQHREMTPEDYEMLLRLDEGVAPKTISKDVIGSFKTDIVDESMDRVGVCSVCMEAYEVGQKRKYLPCEHVFHEGCIDMWLSNSSQNCPLDGLPVS